MSDGELLLHEELLLFGLHETKGTVACPNVEIAMAGGVLAELVFARRIEIDRGSEALVRVRSSEALGDAVIDAVLPGMAGEERLLGLSSWVSRIARAKGLVPCTAESLCARGVLREEEGRHHLLFSARGWPRLDRGVERGIVERARRAVLTDAPDVDERAIALVVLAHRANLLHGVLRHDEITACRERLRALCSESPIGDAVYRAVLDGTHVLDLAGGQFFMVGWP